LFLRILFLLTQSLESPGGGARFFPLAKEMVRLGHEATIIALHPHFTAVPPNERRLTAEGVRVIYAAQMHVRKVDGRKSYFNPIQLIWVVLWAIIQLTREAWRIPADTVVVGKPQPMNLAAAWLVWLLKRIPVYVDSDDYEAEHNRFSARWQQRLVAWFEDWPVRWAAGFSVGNQYIFDRYHALGVPSSRLHLLYNGVDFARFAPLREPEAVERLAALRRQLPFPAEARLVVYVGSLRLTTHAVDLLLEAWLKVTAVEPLARLLLVGGGEDEPLVRAQIADLGLQETVHLAGQTSMAHAPFYYALGEFSVDPRRASLAAESSFSLKLVESLAAGVPCVTADIGDRAQLGGAACIAVPPDDVEALAQAMIRLLCRPAELAAKREAAVTMQPDLWWRARAGIMAKMLGVPQPQID
jgi:glycosyltransferase involved in cell wall biosynthesis